MPRPRLTDEEKQKRAEAKKTEVELRDSIRIFFSPLQFARLRDYHRQGGPLPGEQIRMAVNVFHRELIASREYTPSPDATPEGAKIAWEKRLADKKARVLSNSEQAE